MSNKRILKSVITPKNSDSIEEMDMLKYRVDYLREKRLKGELPPLRPLTLAQRVKEWRTDYKFDWESPLLFVLLIPLAIIALPFLPFFLGKEMYDKRIRRRRIIKSWDNSLLEGELPKSLANISNLRPKYLQWLSSSHFWKENREKIKALLIAESNIDTAHDFLELAIADSQSKNIEERRRWDLSEEEGLLLRLSLIRSKRLRKDILPLELVLHCLRSPLVTLENFSELASICEENFKHTTSMRIYREICILFSMALIRVGEPQVAALPLVFLGMLPDAKDQLNASTLQLKSASTLIASIQNDLPSSRILAHAILAPRRRLLCHLEYMFGRMFFIFIGSRGVIMHDCSSCGLNNDKLNDLLRRTHGLMTVAPTAKMNYNGDDENLKFVDSFMKNRFREELAEDADRLSDGAMSDLLLEISNLIVEPIAAAESALCSKPLSGFINFPNGGKMSFLPIDSSQIYAIENKYPSRPPISLDIRQHHLPDILISKQKIDTNILMIGDPSSTLDFSEEEIDLISNHFAKARIFKLSMDDAILYSRRKRLMPDIGIVHFVGHHSIAYKGNLKSILPGVIGDISENDFIGVFSYFRAQLNFLSACSTNSTFFTDPSAQKMSLSRRILDRYPCNVVSTLWPIPDQAAAHFASCFYQNLVNHKGNPEISLWASKRAFARGEVSSFLSAPTESSRLGGSAKNKFSRITSPASWGAYTLN